MQGLRNAITTAMIKRLDMQMLSKGCEIYVH